MAIELVRVTSERIDELGFFCKKSKRNTEGWRAKRAWSDAAATSGVKTWIAVDGKRQVGFIEFAPAASCWRVIEAAGHLVIHCVWVVGSAKQQGTGRRLLEVALAAARSDGLGVAALASTRKGWLVGPELLSSAGFEHLQSAPPCFELWAVTPDDRPKPWLPQDWDARAAAFGEGLTLVYTHQCPYVDHMRRVYAAAANRHGKAYREVLLDTSEAVRARAPAPYGVFSVVLDGRLLTWRYESDGVLDRSVAAMGLQG